MLWKKTNRNLESKSEITEMKKNHWRARQQISTSERKIKQTGRQVNEDHNIRSRMKKEWRKMEPQRP
jgi:hypothetical protein